MSEVDDPAVRAQDWTPIRAWAGRHLADATALPISFVYDGETVRGIPAAWSPESATRRLSSTIVESTFTGRAPDGTGLQVRVEVIRYLDHPVVEWTAFLTNTGDSPTAVVENLLALDSHLPGTGAALRHSNGDFNSGDGYTWTSTPLASGEVMELEPSGGRPCDEAFPYFRLLFDDGGLSLAVGWPGQWRARFAGRTDAVAVQAGQALTHLRLAPGETIRTPRMTILSWDGDEARAVNLWRRWYLAHVMPRPGGKPMTPLLQVSGTGEGVEFTGATEDNQIEFQQRFADHGIDYDVWWIDAGWYPCAQADGTNDWRATGSWRPEPGRFPQGLAPVAASTRSHGALLLLWFEPERVYPGTDWFEQLPDWLLDRSLEHSPEATSPAFMERSRLLDLSNDVCRSWVSDFLNERIATFGLNIYRQDFNFPPLEYWRANDGDDRQGVTENRYVQGYLALWDSLLERHPDLLIDSCASGGRRNDLETMRRSVPLHYTDYGYGHHPVKLDFHRTMFEWIPYFREMNVSWDLDAAHAAGLPAQEQDSFGLHCALSPMLGITLDIKRPEDYDFDLLRQLVALWRRASPFVTTGDYYALTPPGRTGTEWVGVQFCQPDGEAGFVQGIRLADNREPTVVLRPQRLRADGMYLFEEAETGERRAVSGSTLSTDGLTITLPPRSGSVWFYRAQD